MIHELPVDTSETVEGEPKSRDMGLELDLPELGDDPLPQHARTTDESNTIMAFWQFMISFVLFKFLGMRNDRKAIKSDPEKKDLPGTEEVKEEEQPIVTTDIVPIPEAVTVSFD